MATTDDSIFRLRRNIKVKRMEKEYLQNNLSSVADDLQRLAKYLQEAPEKLTITPDANLCASNGSTFFCVDFNLLKSIASKLAEYQETVRYLFQQENHLNEIMISSLAEQNALVE